MPKVPDPVGDQITNVEEFVKDIVLSGELKIVAGCGRKANTGNFENLDLFLAAGLPVQLADMVLDDPRLQEIINQAATVAFAAVTKEVMARYEMIKNLQKGGRAAAEETK